MTVLTSIQIRGLAGELTDYISPANPIYNVWPRLKIMDRNYIQSQLLYAQGKVNAVMKITMRYDKDSFSGNYEFWASLARILLLRARIYRQSGESQRWKESLRYVRSVSPATLSALDEQIIYSRSLIGAEPDLEEPLSAFMGYLSLFANLVEAIETRHYQQVSIKEYEGEFNRICQSLKELGIASINKSRKMI